jgi:hypothetical protein
VTSQGKGPPRPQGGGTGIGGFIALFLFILVIEVVLDIVLFPADEVLVPAELIGDALLLAAGGTGAFLASRGSRGSSGSWLGRR